MPSLRHARRIARCGLAASCLLALGACALPRVTRRPAQTEYRLRTPQLHQPADIRVPVMLRVTPVLAAPGLDGVAMLYSARPLQLMPYRDSRWWVPPAEMIDAALRRALARQPWVAAVEGDASPAPAAWTLSCRLESLEHDVYRRRAALDLGCQLFDDPARRLRAAWNFDGVQSLAEQDAADYAQATQTLLERAVADALRHVAATLQQPAPGADAAPGGR